MQTSPDYPVFDVSGAAAASGLLRLSEQGSRRFGDLFALRFEDGSDRLLLASAEHVGQWQAQTHAFAKDFDLFPTSAALTRLVLGPSLLTARQGEEWGRMRKEMTSLMRLSRPWFAAALETATAELLAGIEEKSAANQDFSLMPLAIDWAVRSVCHPILGPGVPHEIAVGLVESLQSCFLVMARHGGSSADDFTSLPEFKDARIRTGEVLDLVFENLQAGGETIAAVCHAALPAGLSLQEQKEEVGNVVIGLIAASLHINALALVWMLTSVARDRDLSERLFQETVDLPAGSSDQVTKTPLAFAAVRETQRLFPALPFIERRLTEDMTFSGHPVPAGTIVLFANWLIQRDPRYWQDPKAFCPDRFLPGAPQTPHSYFPFGAGPRTCSGMNLTFQLLTYTLRMLVSRFDFRLSDDTRPGDLAPVMQVNLEPRGEIRLFAVPRAGQCEGQLQMGEAAHA